MREDLSERQDKLKARITAKLNLTRIYKMVRAGATNDEISDRFGWNHRDFYKRVHDDHELAETIRKGRASLKISLRQSQVKLAQSGHCGMLIWLGKQLLGQKESVTLAGDASNPLELTVSSAAELLAAKIRQLNERGSEVGDGGVIDLPSTTNGANALRREIEAARKPNGGTS